MLTEAMIKEKLADLEQQYVEHVIQRFGEWEVWAEASQKIADGKEVRDDEIPEVFHAELKMMRVILEMENLGTFDWNNPRLRQIFGEIVKEPFYLFFGGMITSIALRLADIVGARTLLEIGAGKANLTNIMLEQMCKKEKQFPLVVTDAQPVILDTIKGLKDNYPQASLEELLWNIVDAPTDELRSKVVSPTLLYERYTLNYAALQAFENIAQVADLLILGDWFNHTGKLYAYDEVFKRIGAQPMFFDDLKPLLETHFPNYYIFDQRAIDAIKLPNITLLIAWK